LLLRVLEEQREPSTTCRRDVEHNLGSSNSERVEGLTEGDGHEAVEVFGNMELSGQRAEDAVDGEGLFHRLVDTRMLGLESLQALKAGSQSGRLPIGQTHTLFRSGLGPCGLAVC